MVAARTAFLVFTALMAVTLVSAGLACQPQASRGPAPSDAPAPSAPSAPAMAPALPVLALSPQQAAAVTRIQLQRPDDDDPTRRSAIVLERRGDAWRVTAPLRARASADKVAALLANL